MVYKDKDNVRNGAHFNKMIKISFVFMSDPIFLIFQAFESGKRFPDVKEFTALLQNLACK